MMSNVNEFINDGHLPRVAFFPDSFNEVNGAAMTCRRLGGFAGDNELPMLCVVGDVLNEKRTDRSMTFQSFKRSVLSVKMDKGLAFDPLFLRHYRTILDSVVDFRPDVIHITGLNDVSILGAYIAHRLKIPLIASWHTNLHEFASHRLSKLLRFVPKTVGEPLCKFVENRILDGTLLYYRMPKVILSPNTELQELITKRTGRLSLPMFRGVDTEFFSPEKRKRKDKVFTIGFVGRLQAEKNVELLIELERELIAANRTEFQWLIVGDGAERENLSQNLTKAVFTGFIGGEELATAYADMDVFVFPSETDAYGNVIQEAHASGVPTIVSAKGGPKFLVAEGETGFVANDRKDFVKHLITLMDDRERLRNMSDIARSTSHSRSWDGVFSDVYSAYQKCIDLAKDKETKVIEPAYDSPDHTRSLGAVTSRLLRHPVKEMLLKWNWKTAFLSASMRAGIFLVIYLQQRQGLLLSAGAFATQFVLRAFMGGISGSVIQAYSKVHPAWHAAVIVPFFVVLISHLFEFLAQAVFDSVTNTAAGTTAVLISILVSVISILFNLFAMRRGSLLVQVENQPSLWTDLRTLPKIALEFILLPFTWAFRRP